MTAYEVNTFYADHLSDPSDWSDWSDCDLTQTATWLNCRFMAITESYKAKKARLSEDLELIPDPFERLEQVVDMGRKAEPLAAELHQDMFKVEGCTSQLWLVPSYSDGLCYFKADADSAIVKGIAAILCELYSGEPPETVMAEGPEFLRAVGVTQHLTPNRRNGLGKVYERMAGFAKSCIDA